MLGLPGFCSFLGVGIIWDSAGWLGRWSSGIWLLRDFWWFWVSSFVTCYDLHWWFCDWRLVVCIITLDFVVPGCYFRVWGLLLCFFVRWCSLVGGCRCEFVSLCLCCWLHIGSLVVFGGLGFRAWRFWVVFGGV